MKTSTRLLTAVSFVFSFLLLFSCSDNDDKPVSRYIDKVDIYKGVSNNYELLSVMSLTYEPSGKLREIENQNPFFQAFYTYHSKDSISYSFLYGTSSGAKTTKVTARVDNIRTETATFNNGTKYIYSYDYGYLKRVYMGSKEIKYTWENGNLVSIDDPYYSDKFKPSSIDNNYELDLNVLQQFVDTRDDYLSVMNTFGQVVGILGKKSKNLIESTAYDYQYGFDDRGRILMITLTEKNYKTTDPVTYVFRINYRK